MSGEVVSRSFGVSRAAASKTPGREAVATKGWWRAHRFLLLRRLSQLSILALFLLGPLAGVWIVKGNLNFSYTLGVLPLTDLFVGAQTLATGHVPQRTSPTAAAARRHTLPKPPATVQNAGASPVSIAAVSAALRR